MFTVVGFALLDLRSHVGHGSSVGLESINFLVCGKSKVSNFEIEIIIYKNVFKFQISVDNSFSLHVAKYVYHLTEEVSSTVFSHSSHGLAKVKQETTWNVFEVDVDKVLDLSS